MRRGTLFLLMATHVAAAAGTYVMSSLAARGFVSAEALTLARALGATFLLLALTGSVIPKPDFDGRTWLKLLGLGVLQVPVNQYLFLRGLQTTAPGHAALLYALTPLLVLLLSSLAARERPAPRRVLGILVALAGVFCVLRPWETGAAASAMRYGDLLVLAAVIAWAIYTVAVRGLLQRHDPRTVTAWSLILGSLTMMPLGGAALKATDPAAIPTHAWLGLLWMVVITSVVMNLLWSVLLRHLHPVQVAVCMNAQPPATALLQTILGAAAILPATEPLGWPFAAGMVLVIVGVVCVQTRKVRAGANAAAR